MHGQGNYAPYIRPGGTSTPPPLFRQGISEVPQLLTVQHGPSHFINFPHQTDIPTQPQQPHVAPLATNMLQTYLNPPQPPYGNPPNVPAYIHSGPLYNQPIHGQTFHHMRQPDPMVLRTPPPPSPLPPMVLQTPPPPPPMQGHSLFRNPPPLPSAVQHLPIPPPPPSSSYVSITPVPFASFRQNDLTPSPPPPSLPPSPPPLPPSSPPPASPMLHVPDVTRECLPIDTSTECSNEKLAAEVERGHSCSEMKDSLVKGKASSSPPPRPDEEVVKDIEDLCRSIAKVGPSFVNDTLSREANNPRFSFLFGGEPGSAAAIGHAYFQWLKTKVLLDKDNLVTDVLTSSASDMGKVMEGRKMEEASNVFVKDGNPFKLIEDYSSDKGDDLSDELHHSPSMSPIGGHSFPSVSPKSPLPTDNSTGSINIAEDNVNCDKNILDSRADRNFLGGDINAFDCQVEKMQSDEPMVQKNTLVEADVPSKLVGESVSHESSSLNQRTLPSQSQPLMNQSTQYMPSMDGNLPSSAFPRTNWDHPHHPLPHHQHPPGSFTYPSNVDLNLQRYPYEFPERNLPHDALIPRVTPHYNPYASTFENPLPSLRVGGTGLRTSASPFESKPLMDVKFLPSDGIQMLNATTSRDSITRLYTRDSSAEVASQKLSTRDAARGEPYDPLLDSIDPSPSVFNKVNHVQNFENDQVTMSKHVRPPDIKENNSHKWDTTAAKSDDDEYVELAMMDAEVGAVENASPGLVDAKGRDPDIPNSGNVAAGEIEVAQVQSQVKSKKNKDSRSMKLFKTALADFVKQVLKPTWRQGTMSKEEFKTIVKKTVDKVSGAMPSHNIPKSQEKIDQYVRSSERKLTNLVMGYVDKYVKL